MYCTYCIVFCSELHLFKMKPILLHVTLNITLTNNSDRHQSAAKCHQIVFKYVKYAPSLIVWLFTPISTCFKLYHGVSWVSYQYYWSVHPDTSQSVVVLTPQPWAPRRATITVICIVFGMTRPGIESAPSRAWGVRSTTTPSRQLTHEAYTLPLHRRGS